MAHPRTLRAVWDRRQQAVAELRRFTDEYEHRAFTPEAQAEYDRITAAIDGCDERIEHDLDELARDDKIAEARFNFEQRTGYSLGGDGPAGRTAGEDAAKLRSLVTREARAVEFAPEYRDLSKSTTAAGGALVPTSFYGRVHEHLTETSTVLLGNATILRTESGEDVHVPKTTGYSAAVIVGEGQPIGESDPAFDKVTLGAYKYAFLIQVARELLDDRGFNLEAFLARQGGIALGSGIGTHLIAGTNTGQPHGLRVAATVGVTAPSNSAVSADDVLDLYHAVPTPYRSRSVWVMKDSTVKAIRKLKDSTGQYLWQPGLAAGQPDTLLGRPLLTDDAMEAIGPSKTTVAFGDLSGYYTRMAGPLRVERSDDYAFNADLVTFRFIQRADGDLVDTVGVRTLRNAA